MLELKLLKGVTEDKRLPQTDAELSAYCAYEGGELRGYCLFRFAKDSIELTELISEPKSFSVADGLVRAAVRYGENSNKTVVRIVGESDELFIFAAVMGVFSDNAASIEDFFNAGEGGCSVGCDGCSEGCCALRVDKFD